MLSLALTNNLSINPAFQVGTAELDDIAAVGTFQRSYFKVTTV